jgi:hypothetical protein
MTARSAYQIIHMGFSASFMSQPQLLGEFGIHFNPLSWKRIAPINFVAESQVSPIFTGIAGTTNACFQITKTLSLRKCKAEPAKPNGFTMTHAITNQSSRPMDEADDGQFLREQYGSDAAPPAGEGSIREEYEEVNALLDEASVPNRVGHGFTSQAGVSDAIQVRRRTSLGTASCVPPSPSREASISDLVHLALSRSGYPLQNIRCWNDDQTVTLSGFASRYFYVQVAVEAARMVANGRRINAQIEVVPYSDL